MKKLYCLTLVLLLVLSCLSSCNFAQNLTDKLEDKSESPIKVEEMMEALAKNLIDDAKALMHPKTTSEDMTARFEQMIDFLDGREVVSMELEGINVSSSIGTSGNTKQEDLFYKATLSDNSVVYINAVYLADDDGAGFTSFQLVLGIV